MKRKPAAKQNGWRGSRDLWLDAAHEILVTSGFGEVKIMPLAKALNLSRTSFYWHFEDREALLDVLIARWQKKNTGNLVAQTGLYAETIAEAVFNLFDCWVDPALFDAKLDFAIRNWAQSEPELKKILEKADRKRVAAIQAMFARYDYSGEQADIRAHTVYYTQVGYISMMVEETREGRFKRIPGYVESFTGVVPSEPEIARFLARHGSMKLVDD